MPSIDGGPQEDPRWSEVNEPKPAAESARKFDFQNMDIKLYLALKALMTPILTSADIKQQAALEENAKLALQEFELSQGPMPEWAIARNWGYKLVPGAQLMTRDGRVTGNAHVLRVHPKDSGLELYTVYDCITDAGSFIRSMRESELESQFWIGDYISDPKTLIARFGNHGQDYGFPT